MSVTTTRATPQHANRCSGRSDDVFQAFIPLFATGCVHHVRITVTRLGGGVKSARHIFDDDFDDASPARPRAVPAVKPSSVQQLRVVADESCTAGKSEAGTIAAESAQSRRFSRDNSHQRRPRINVPRKCFMDEPSAVGREVLTRSRSRFLTIRLKCDKQKGFDLEQNGFLTLYTL
jgi:hypothetical protein